MSIKTKIQWSDSTVNPIMGCDGCELWPSIGQIKSALRKIAGPGNSPEYARRIDKLLEGRLPTDVYHARQAIAKALALPERPEAEGAIEQAISRGYRCYAGILHLRHGTDEAKPAKITSTGYARKFEMPRLFPGRMAEASRWSDLRRQPRPDKPWMDGLPRMIFVSDMADALSKDVPFDYLMKEIIQNVSSPTGERHIWLWLTKRPRRMAEFSQWLLSQGQNWPDNLIAMTSVTSQQTIGRVAELCKVECCYRGLSVEPLRTPVDLPLDGVDWVIVGGESGSYAEPFHLEWATSVLAQWPALPAA